MAEVFTRQYFQEKGKKGGEKGGKTTKKRHGKKHYIKIGKEGAAKRWANHNKRV